MDLAEWVTPQSELPFRYYDIAGRAFGFTMPGLWRLPN